MTTCLWRYWHPTQNYLEAQWLPLKDHRYKTPTCSCGRQQLQPVLAANSSARSSTRALMLTHSEVSPLPLCLPAATAAWQAMDAPHCKSFRAAQRLSQQEKIHSWYWSTPGTMHSGRQMAKVLLNKAMWDQLGSLTGKQMYFSKAGIPAWLCFLVSLKQ